MTPPVLDASALLALLQQEPGEEKVRSAIEANGGTMSISSVNFCEVITKLIRDGGSPGDIASIVRPFARFVVVFDVLQAEEAAYLFSLTRQFGLSLADRACLALAQRTGASAWTADRVWSKLSIGVEVKTIRP